MNTRPRRTPASISIGRLAPGLVAALLSGCVGLESPVPKGRSVREVYEESDGQARSQGKDKARLRIERERGPGTPEKTRPVIYPPKIFAVYVAEHLDRERDMKVGAHYVYVKLRDSSWVEEPIDREPEASGDADAADVARLKDRMGGDRFTKTLLPYRAGPEPGNSDPKSDPEKDKGRGRDKEKEFDVTTEGDRP